MPKGFSFIQGVSSFIRFLFREEESMKDRLAMDQFQYILEKCDSLDTQYEKFRQYFLVYKCQKILGDFIQGIYRKMWHTTLNLAKCCGAKGMDKR